MAGSVYYEQIEDTFEKVETAIEALPDDVDIRCGGRLTSRLAMVSFPFCRQPPTEQLWFGNAGWIPLSLEDAEEDWVDTKTGARFSDFLVEELLTHTGLRLEWGSVIVDGCRRALGGC